MPASYEILLCDGPFARIPMSLSWEMIDFVVES